MGRPQMRLGTCICCDALDFGANLKFRRCSYATAHVEENRMPIIETLRYFYSLYEN